MWYQQGRNKIVIHTKKDDVLTSLHACERQFFFFSSSNSSGVYLVLAKQNQPHLELNLDLDLDLDQFTETGANGKN